jgi:hypothetical protein
MRMRVETVRGAMAVAGRNSGGKLLKAQWRESVKWGAPL